MDVLASGNGRRLDEGDVSARIRRGLAEFV